MINCHKLVLNNLSEIYIGIIFFFRFPYDLKSKMENNLLSEQVKSQFEINKEGGKCKMCKKFYKGKLSNHKDHFLRKDKEAADEIELVEATPAKWHRNDDEIQLIKRIKLEVDVNQLIREMIRLMVRRNLSLVHGYLKHRPINRANRKNNWRPINSQIFAEG